jgi:hypothetical protein
MILVSINSPFNLRKKNDYFFFNVYISYIKFCLTINNTEQKKKYMTMRQMTD